MNKIYRLKFDKRRNELVVVSEITSVAGKAKNSGQITGLSLLKFLPGKLLRLSLLTGLMAGLLSVSVRAENLPAGGQIVAGAGSIAVAGNTLTVRQDTPSLAAEWQSFNIGQSHSVQFVQPDSSAIALNRVTGASPSQIMGTLNANGRVFLLNPNGVVFGKDASVNTGGLLVTTKNISTADFMRGNYQLNAGSAAEAQIINQGALTTSAGGFIVLAADKVSNQGTISAEGGKAVLAAADKVRLQLDQSGLTGVTVSGSLVNALAENNGLISAQNGQVYLTARGRDMLLKTAVNNSGSIVAGGLSVQGGVIRLDGGNSGVVRQSGVLSADSASATGGDITIEGQYIHLTSSSRISATGENGGGTVRVGGGWKGQDQGVKNAAKLVMDKGAIINVSASGKGDGGTAVLWSQQYTDFRGQILARGGRQGGNGGRVETSSAGNLQAFGDVDASALRGKGGFWLLDPTDVEIVTDTSSTNVSETVPPAVMTDSSAMEANTDHKFAPQADGAKVSAGKIAEQLNKGVSVTVETSGVDTSGQSGNITVNASISKTGEGDATLTLKADNNITIAENINISATAGKLGLSLLAGATGNNARVTLGNNISVSLNGGDFYTGAANPAHNISLAFSGNGTIQAQDITLNLAGGLSGQSYNLQASNNLTLNGLVNVSASGGMHTCFSAGGHLVFDAATGNISLLSNSTAGGGGNITLSGDKGVTLTARSGLVLLNSAAGAANTLNISSAEGDIALSGNVTDGSAVDMQHAGVNATAGNVTIHGNSAGNGDAINASNSSITAGQDIEIHGNGGTRGIFLNVTSLNASAGNVTLNASSGNVGVVVANTRVNARDITVSGVVTDPWEGARLGINIWGNSNLSAVNVSLSGKGATGVQLSNISSGMAVVNILNVSGMLNITGNTSGEGTGINIENITANASGGTVVISGSGGRAGITVNNSSITGQEITVQGTGTQHGVSLNTRARLTASGNATINGSGGNAGVIVNNSSVTGQEITVQGTGVQHAVSLNTSARLTASGNVAISGQSSGNNFNGVDIRGASSVTSDGGSISIQGTGGGHGVYLDGITLNSSGRHVILNGTAANNIATWLNNVTLNALDDIDIKGLISTEWNNNKSGIVIWGGSNLSAANISLHGSGATGVRISNPENMNLVASLNASRMLSVTGQGKRVGFDLNGLNLTLAISQNFNLSSLGSGDDAMNMLGRGVFNGKHEVLFDLLIKGIEHNTRVNATGVTDTNSDRVIDAGKIDLVKLTKLLHSDAVAEAESNGNVYVNTSSEDKNGQWSFNSVENIIADSGDVMIVNTGLATGLTVQAKDGNITLSNNGRITLGNVMLNASKNLTLNGGGVTATGATVQAGNGNITLNNKGEVILENVVLNASKNLTLNTQGVTGRARNGGNLSLLAGETLNVYGTTGGVFFDSTVTTRGGGNILLSGGTGVNISSERRFVALKSVAEATNRVKVISSSGDVNISSVFSHGHSRGSGYTAIATDINYANISSVTGNVTIRSALRSVPTVDTIARNARPFLIRNSNITASAGTVDIRGEGQYRGGVMNTTDLTGRDVYVEGKSVAFFTRYDFLIGLGIYGNTRISATNNITINGDVSGTGSKGLEIFNNVNISAANALRVIGRGYYEFGLQIGNDSAVRLVGKTVNVEGTVSRGEAANGGIDIRGSNLTVEATESIHFTGRNDARTGILLNSTNVTLDSPEVNFDGRGSSGVRNMGGTVINVTRDDSKVAISGIGNNIGFDLTDATVNMTDRENLTLSSGGSRATAANKLDRGVIGDNADYLVTLAKRGFDNTTDINVTGITDSSPDNKVIEGDKVNLVNLAKRIHGGDAVDATGNTVIDLLGGAGSGKLGGLGFSATEAIVKDSGDIIVTGISEIDGLELEAKTGSIQVTASSTGLRGIAGNARRLSLRAGDRLNVTAQTGNIVFDSSAMANGNITLSGKNGVSIVARNGLVELKGGSTATNKLEVVSESGDILFQGRSDNAGVRLECVTINASAGTVIVNGSGAGNGVQIISSNITAQNIDALGVVSSRWDGEKTGLVINGNSNLSATNVSLTGRGNTGIKAGNGAGITEMLNVTGSLNIIGQGLRTGFDLTGLNLTISNVDNMSLSSHDSQPHTRNYLGSAAFGGADGLVALVKQGIENDTHVNVTGVTDSGTDKVIESDKVNLENLTKKIRSPEGDNITAYVNLEALTGSEGKTGGWRFNATENITATTGDVLVLGVAGLSGSSIQAQDGNITLKNQGRLELENVQLNASKNITLENTGLQATARNGGTLEFTAGEKLSINAVTGDIIADSSVATGGGGNVSLSGVSGVDITAQNGRVELKSATGSDNNLNVQSDNGDITLSAARLYLDHASLNATAGNVSVSGKRTDNNNTTVDIRNTSSVNAGKNIDIQGSGGALGIYLENIVLNTSAGDIMINGSGANGGVVLHNVQANGTNADIHGTVTSWRDGTKTGVIIRGNSNLTVNNLSLAGTGTHGVRVGNAGSSETLNVTGNLSVTGNGSQSGVDLTGLNLTISDVNNFRLSSAGSDASAVNRLGNQSFGGADGLVALMKQGIEHNTYVSITGVTDSAATDKVIDADKVNLVNLSARIRPGAATENGAVKIDLSAEGKEGGWHFAAAEDITTATGDIVLQGVAGFGGATIQANDGSIILHNEKRTELENVSLIASKNVTLESSGIHASAKDGAAVVISAGDTLRVNTVTGNILFDASAASGGSMVLSGAKGVDIAAQQGRSEFKAAAGDNNSLNISSADGDIAISGNVSNGRGVQLNHVMVQADTGNVSVSATSGATTDNVVDMRGNSVVRAGKDIAIRGTGGALGIYLEGTELNASAGNLLVNGNGTSNGASLNNISINARNVDLQGTVSSSHDGNKTGLTIHGGSKLSAENISLAGSGAHGIKVINNADGSETVNVTGLMNIHGQGTQMGIDLSALNLNISDPANLTLSSAGSSAGAVNRLGNQSFGGGQGLALLVKKGIENNSYVDVTGVTDSTDSNKIIHDGRVDLVNLSKVIQPHAADSGNKAIDLRAEGKTGSWDFSAVQDITADTGDIIFHGLSGLAGASVQANDGNIVLEYAGVARLENISLNASKNLTLETGGVRARAKAGETLTLTAGEKLRVIASENTIVFDASATASAGGQINLSGAKGVEIVAHNGRTELKRASGDNASLNVTAQTGDILLSGNVSAGKGVVLENVRLAAKTGDVSIDGRSSATTDNTVDIAGTQVDAGGNIRVSGTGGATGVVFNGAVLNASAGTLEVIASGNGDGVWMGNTTITAINADIQGMVSGSRESDRTGVTIRNNSSVSADTVSLTGTGAHGVRIIGNAGNSETMSVTGNLNIHGVGDYTGFDLTALNLTISNVDNIQLSSAGSASVALNWLGNQSFAGETGLLALMEKGIEHSTHVVVTGISDSAGSDASGIFNNDKVDLVRLSERLNPTTGTTGMDTVINLSGRVEGKAGGWSFNQVEAISKENGNITLNGFAGADDLQLEAKNGGILINAPQGGFRVTGHSANASISAATTLDIVSLAGDVLFDRTGENEIALTGNRGVNITTKDGRIGLNATIVNASHGTISVSGDQKQRLSTRTGARNTVGVRHGASLTAQNISIQGKGNFLGVYLDGVTMNATAGNILLNAEAHDEGIVVENTVMEAARQIIQSGKVTGETGDTKVGLTVRGNTTLKAEDITLRGEGEQGVRISSANNLSPTLDGSSMVTVLGKGSRIGFTLTGLAGITHPERLSLSSQGSALTATNVLDNSVVKNTEILLALIRQGIENSTLVDTGGITDTVVMTDGRSIVNEGRIDLVALNDALHGTSMADGTNTIVDLTANNKKGGWDLGLLADVTAQTGDLIIKGVAGFDGVSVSAKEGSISIGVPNGGISKINNSVLTAKQNLTITPSDAGGSVRFTSAKLEAGGLISVNSTGGTLMLSDSSINATGNVMLVSDAPDGDGLRVTNSNLSSAAGNVALKGMTSGKGKVTGLDVNNVQLAAAAGNVSLEGIAPASGTGIKLTGVTITAAQTDGKIDIRGESRGINETGESASSVSVNGANRLTGNTITLSGHNKGTFAERVESISASGSGITFERGSQSIFSGNTLISGSSAQGSAVALHTGNAPVLRFENGTAELTGELNGETKQMQPASPAAALALSGANPVIELHDASLKLVADVTKTHSDGITSVAVQDGSKLAFRGNGDVSVEGRVRSGAGINSALFKNNELTGKLSITGSSITGTGALVTDNRDASLVNADISGVSESGYGVMISANNALDLTGLTVTGTTTSGEAGLVLDTLHDGTTTITGGSLNGEASAGNGAGILLSSGANYALNDVALNGKAVSGDGVRISAVLSGNARLQGSATRGNGVQISDGAIVHGAVIQGTSDSGSGVALTGAVTLNEEVVRTLNASAKSGTGLRLEDSRLQVVNSELNPVSTAVALSAKSETGSAIHSRGNVSISGVTLTAVHRGDEGAGVTLEGALTLNDAISGISASAEGAANALVLNNISIKASGAGGREVELAATVNGKGNAVLLKGDIPMMSLLHIRGTAKNGGTGVNVVDANLSDGSITGVSDRGTGVNLTGNSRLTDMKISGHSDSGAGVSTSGDIKLLRTHFAGSTADGLGIQTGGVVSSDDGTTFSGTATASGGTGVDVIGTLTGGSVSGKSVDGAAVNLADGSVVSDVTLTGSSQNGTDIKKSAGSILNGISTDDEIFVSALLAPVDMVQSSVSKISEQFAAGMSADIRALPLALGMNYQEQERTANIRLQQGNQLRILSLNMNNPGSGEAEPEEE